ncbi:hypothetical protein [Streptomyces sp. NPDC057375]
MSVQLQTVPLLHGGAQLLASVAMRVRAYDRRSVCSTAYLQILDGA